MKRMFEYTKAQEGALAVALIVLLAACGFALLQALGSGSAAANVVGPLFTPF